MCVKPIVQLDWELDLEAVVSKVVQMVLKLKILDGFGILDGTSVANCHRWHAITFRRFTNRHFFSFTSLTASAKASWEYFTRGARTFGAGFGPCIRSDHRILLIFLFLFFVCVIRAV